MIYVGIDVAKDKHDCCITNDNVEVVVKPFSFQNSIDGFNSLLQMIHTISGQSENIKVGLEATGHYSFNLMAFLINNGLKPYVINPLHTCLYRKSLSLRQTKTDKVDAYTIALMLMSDVNLKSYSDSSYHNEELKSLTRYRFDKVKARSRLKVSISRLVSILFPELEQLVPTLHISSVYSLLCEFPGARFVASAHLTRLSNLLYTSSKGHYGKDMAVSIRNAARNSIGSYLPVKSLELKHTIHLIRELDSEISEIEDSINSVMDALDTPILSIPGISYRMGAMIIAEIGDISRFASPDKLLAYAGLSPSVYQSGQFNSCHAHMEKRGSRYLRYALFNAAKFVCIWDPVFREYLAKKRSEGKHYNVAVSHAVKKLVRLIYSMEKSRAVYKAA